MNSSSKPMYERIYEELKNAILSGRYQPGERIPSEHELAEQYGVSRITTKKALELITADGLLLRQPGRGSFVSQPPAGQVRPALTPNNPEGGRNLIGLIMTDFDDSYGTGLLSGIEKAATEHDRFVVLRRSFGDPAHEEKAIQSLLNCGVDGLIIFPAQNEHFSAEILKLVINEFPLVLVDRYLKGVAATAVSTDNVGAARAGTDYLLDLGHRHIGLLTPPPMDTTAIEDRLEGFVQAHAERGVMVDRSLWLTDLTCTLPGNFQEPNIGSDTGKVAALLQQNPQITAVLAIEYNIALLAKAAAERIGRKVPEDLSILCFDNPVTPFTGYRFTHLLQNQELMGHTALEAVMRLKNGEKLPTKVLLNAELVKGESTQPPK